MQLQVASLDKRFRSTAFIILRHMEFALGKCVNQRVLFKKRRRYLIYFQLGLILIFFVYFSRKLPDPHPPKDEPPGKLFCADNHLAIKRPKADGLVIKADIHPDEWRMYDGTSRNISDQRIFFHETSGRSQLSLRQCCAVESAARNNPDRPVQLLMRSSTNCASTDPIKSQQLPMNPSWLKVLSRYPNVEIVLLNQDHYFAGTPLEDWYTKGVWRTSRFEMGHLSDYIRVLTLYKGGGLYLDMDILTLKAFQGPVFRNCLVYENAAKDTIGNSVLHLERGHHLSGELIRLLAEEYDPEAYVYHGPDAIAEMMNRVCGLVAGNPKSNECNNVRLLSHRYFHPVAAMFSHMLFQNDGNMSDVETLFEIKESFGLHLWNSISLHHPINVDNKNQIVAILAREHCPLTVSRAADFN